MKKFIKDYAVKKDVLVKIVEVFLISFTAFLFLKICYLNFLADLYFEKATDAQESLDPKTALKNIDLAIARNALEPNYHRVRAKILVSFLPRQQKDSQNTIKNMMLADMKMAYDLNPKNLVTVRNLIPVYYFFAAKDVSAEAGVQNVDQDFLSNTKAFYKKIKNISPNDVGVYALLAKYEKRLGLVDEYAVSVAKVRELRPDLLDWFEGLR